MPLNVEPFRKILKLEQKRGYEDSAVIGGLDKFLRNWSGQFIESISNHHLLGRFNSLQLGASSYSSLSRQQRRDWVKNVLDFLNEIEQVGNIEKGTPVASKKTVVPKTRVMVIPKKRIAGTRQSINSPVTILKGVSQNVAGKFERLGVRTIRDLLYLFPNRHIDYSQVTSISQLKEGEEQTIIANVWEAREVRPGGRRSTEATVGDETGNVKVMWFNNPYLAKKLTTNMRVVISGRVALFNGRYVFESPEWEPAEERELTHTGRLVPIYPLTHGLQPRMLRKLMKGVVDQWAWQLEDPLPSDVKERCHLLGLPEAISQAHYPVDIETKDKARVRLAFDELFFLQLGVLNKKREWQESQPGNPLDSGTNMLSLFLNSLPFELTGAQKKVLKELLDDLQKNYAMSRLLQGEVGSGKTVVATAALLVAVASNYQGALMAPTEILAEQHFTSICNLLVRTGQREEDGNYIRRFSGFLPRSLSLALLIGDMKQSKKQELQQLVSDGKIDIVIGTHSLIQQEVAFNRLGLAVIDEQHRFGVEQRSALRQKGYNPHILVMTATPIPRTLALTLYGDLDLSVINELPPGRQAIKTKWLKPNQRESAYAFINRQIAEGHQAFIICPLVEESDAIQAKAAVAEYERLSQEVFPRLKLGLIHGRMSAEEKDKIMRSFRNKEMDILVSTPVVEVGIDIPNATVMLVESADRFGLSQLHQFRGRVGRGQDQSYCMLMSQNPSEVARERLGIIEKTQDSFVLAEEDLKLRGPGEFFGTRQSGMPDLRMAKLSDVAILEMARNEAMRLFEKDPTLKKPEHKLIVQELSRVWQKGGEWS